MFQRLTLGVTTSAAITFCLLLAMDLLLDAGKVGAVEARRAHLLPFVRVEREPEPVAKKERLPERVPSPSVTPPLVEPEYDDPDGVAVSVQFDSPEPMRPMLDRVGGQADSDLRPIVKVSPGYPPRAAERGIEGHVTVEFTVMTNGAVRDVVVIESTSPLFDRAAVAAASRFRYRPRVVDGVAVESHGVRNRIRFVLD